MKELDPNLILVLPLLEFRISCFHGTKVDEDPHSFIDEVFKVVDTIGVTPREKQSYPLINS